MSTFQGRQEWATKISWFFELWDLVKRGFRSVISYCFFLRGLLCNLEQEYRVGSFHLLSLGQDGRYLRFFFPHLLFFVFAIVASRFDAICAAKKSSLPDTVAQNSGFLTNHITLHKKVLFRTFVFFKKNWLRPLRSCFVFVTVGRMETELRDVSKPECIVSICCRLPPPSSSPQTVHPNLLLRSVERKSFSRHTPRVWKLGLSQKGIDAWKNQGNCSERAEKSGNAI